MMDAISSATSGMQMASTKANEAAEAIVSAQTPPPSTVAQAAPTVSTDTPAIINDIGNAVEADQTQKMLEFKQAVDAYKASAKLLESIQSMQRELVEALGWMPPDDAQGKT
jgi:UDP-N-acetylglucosamine 2-epimerase